MLTTRSIRLIGRRGYQPTLYQSTGIVANYTGAGYKESQEKLGRPVSPHVTIYKFPISAVTSVAIRGTGMSLSAGLMGVGLYSLVGGNAADVFSVIGSIYGLNVLAKFAVSFPLVYHYLGGIRHFYWDANPETLTNEDVERVSYMLIGSSVGLSAVASIL